MRAKMKAVLKPQEIYSLVAEDLIEVESELAGYAASGIEPVSRIARHLLDAGGKRVRPALLLLTARMLGEVTPSAVRLGAVVELIHNATLVHDDVIDEADTRRGRVSAHAHWGNAMTVLAGDWLYMQSFAVALGERNFEVLSTLIEITQKMVEGELLQLTYIGRSDLSEAQLLDIAERKTASLFSGCMKLPAILAGESREDVARCARIGRSLGMAFQLVDDLLDVTSTEEVLGKPVASDLREGKLTLPTLFALGDASDGVRERIGRVLRDRDLGATSPAEIVAAVRQADGVERTRRLAMRYADEAVRLLETCPPSAYRDAISSVPDFIINRQA
jgi:octaprenyl-diphosphate synthase